MSTEFHTPASKNSSATSPSFKGRLLLGSLGALALLSVAIWGGLRLADRNNQPIHNEDIRPITVTTSIASISPTPTETIQVNTPPPPSPSPSPTKTALPAKAYIENVPFIEQAPHKIWDEIHKETCEEASVLAVVHFLRGEPKVSADQIESELQAIIAWEKEHLGIYEDTTAAQTAEILRVYYQLGERVRLIENATLDDLKREVAAGRPVIVPAAGRLLGNKYFQTPGPIYHMTVAIGYDKDSIITNDPGTRRGQDYHYPTDQFWNAVHDFVDRTDEGMARGEKVMIVVD